MFALTDEDRRSRILACADGPASFNAEMTAKGRQVTSFDPLYEFSKDIGSGRCSVRKETGDGTEADRGGDPLRCRGTGDR